MKKQVNVLTFKELKKKIEELSNDERITDETKVFLDTGWDSVQEVEPNAIHVEEIQQFEVIDELNQDSFVGYSLLKKAEKKNAFGASETAIILRNLY